MPTIEDDRQRRAQERDTRTHAILWITVGVVGAFGLLIFLGFAVEAEQQAERQEAAQKYLDESTKAMARANAQVRVIDAEAGAQARIAAARESARVQAEQAAKEPPAMPPGYRCIGKQLFRELPNGFEQVTDGSASTYCR